MFKYCKLWEARQTPESQPLRNFCAGPPTAKVKSWFLCQCGNFFRREL